MIRKFIVSIGAIGAARKLSFCALAGLGTMAVVVALFAPAAPAQATPYPFKYASVEWSPGGSGRDKPAEIHVGYDLSRPKGHRYTHLEGKVKTRFRIKAKVKGRHAIFEYVLTTSDPNLVGNVNASVVGAAGFPGPERMLDETVSFSMDPSAVLSGLSNGKGILPTADQDIIDKCNKAFPNVAGKNTGVETLTIDVHLGVSSQSTKWSDPSLDREAIADTSFPVNVVCMGGRSAHVPQLENIDLHIVQKGKTCPKPTDVTAYVDFDEQTKAKISINFDGQLSSPLTLKTHKVTAFGKTWYRAQHLFGYKLDPGKHKFRVEVENLGKKTKSAWKAITVHCPPFEVLSAWLKYDVAHTDTCPKPVAETATFYTNRPGWVHYVIKQEDGQIKFLGTAKATRSGDQYVATGVRRLMFGEIDTQFMADVTGFPADSGWVLLKIDCLDVLSGKVTLRDANAPACPREAAAAVSIRTDLDGPVPYRLDCNGGRSWVRTAHASKTGPSTFVAVDVLPFQIAHNETVTCVLKTRKPLAVKVLDGKGRKYQCVKHNVKLPAHNLTAPVRPASRSAPAIEHGGRSHSVHRHVAACARGFRRIGTHCVRPRRTSRSMTARPSCRPGQRRVRGRCIRIPTVRTQTKRQASHRTPNGRSLMILVTPH